MLDRGGVRERFRALTDRAGLGRGWTPRDLRTTCATRLADRGKTQVQIADYLGNTPGTVTAHYIKPMLGGHGCADEMASVLQGEAAPNTLPADAGVGAARHGCGRGHARHQSARRQRGRAPADHSARPRAAGSNDQDAAQQEAKRIRGKRARGVKQGSSKLNNDAVREIIRLHNEGWAHPDIARKFGVTPQCVLNVVKGRTWAHVKTPAVKDRKPPTYQPATRREEPPVQNLP